MFTTLEDAGLRSFSGARPAPASPFASLSFSLASGRRHPGFASLSLGPIPGQAKGNDSSSSKLVKEAITGLEFSTDFCTKGSSNCGALTGMGVRAKRILGLKNINVYAVALYVDPSAVKSKLSKYKGQEVDKLAASKSLCNDFIAADSVEKTIRLMINYGGISRDTFWNALKERLEPPLAKAGEKDTLLKFGAQFDDVKFRKGLDIAFTCQGKSTTTWVDGKKVSTIDSPQLHQALMGIYMGDSPVSEDAKANFGRGLASVLAES